MRVLRAREEGTLHGFPALQAHLPVFRVMGGFEMRETVFDLARSG
jgi:hypothetical protein